MGERTVPLTPGMSVAVEGEAGKRRVLDYLASPLIEIIGKAGE